jgi:hypothetical protein
MAKVLQNIFTSNDQISQSATVQSWHVSQSVDAFTGASDYDITISGSLTVTGSTNISGDVSITGNSETTGYSVVGDTIIYSTGGNLAIVNSSSFTPSTDLGNQSNIKIGSAAGQDTAATIESVFIGSPVAVSAKSASYSNFIGAGVGSFATLASGSNFMGYAAGAFAASASFSNLFGYKVGRGDIDGNTIGPNNIIIGTNISLPFNYRNGINIGGILFGSGSYGTPSGDIFSGSVGNGRIGINQPTPSFNLDVSGSGRYTNGVTITGSFISSGSLSMLSTGSIALNGAIILTGSLETTGSVTLRGLTTQSKSFVVTIDNSTGQLFYTSSTGLVSNTTNPGGSNTQIQYNNNNTFDGVPTLTYDIISSTLRATGSFTGSFRGSFTGNLTGTASQATNAFTSSNLNITYNDSTNANFQLLWGSGTRAYGNSNLTVNPSTGRITSNRLQVDGAGTTATGSGAGQIYLNGASNNLIEYNTNGFAPPTFTTRSIGTKIVLYPGVNLPSHVDYAIGIDGFTLWNSVPTSTNHQFRWYAGTTNIATLNGLGQLSLAGGLTVTGSITATNDITAFASSDKRLKDNITPISNPIEKIQKIGGYEFDWNDKQDTYEGHDIGVIAQEIEEVLPELVQTRDNGYKAVKYDKIVALLIEAIKDQQKQIDELKSKIK